MLYAVKIGPIPAGGGDATFYCGFEEESLHAPVMAESDEDGLRRLAAQAPGADLYCDPALAKVGKKLGFQPLGPPEFAKAGTVAMLTALAAGPHGEKLGGPLGLYSLAVAALRFQTSSPWTLWHDDQPIKVTFSGGFKGSYEAAILGNGGLEFGLALYKGKGGVAKVAKLVKGGKGRQAQKVDSLALVFDDEPRFAVELFERLLGLPAVPTAFKLEGGKATPVQEAEVLGLTAALNGLAALHPRAREVIGDAGIEGYGPGLVKAHVLAPDPAGDETVVVKRQ
ncbi:MAG TPA: hypothetical protein VGK67_22095 [Myxococcales bacterium]|jgi:hypothetical protein